MYPESNDNYSYICILPNVTWRIVIIHLISFDNCMKFDEKYILGINTKVFYHLAIHFIYRDVERRH